MKKEYKGLEMEVIEFNVEDVIATSGFSTDNESQNPNDGEAGDMGW